MSGVFRWIENTWLRSAKDAKCLQIDVVDREGSQELVMGPPLQQGMALHPSHVVVPGVGITLGQHESWPLMVDQVMSAFQAGIRHIQIPYGMYEKASLKEVFQKSKLSRDSVFVSMVVCPTESDPASKKTINSVRDKIQLSINHLEITYVDMLVLGGSSDIESNKSYWKIMEEIQTTGFAKSLGAALPSIQSLQELIVDASQIQPSYYQFNLNQNLHDILVHCRELNIVPGIFCDPHAATEYGANVLETGSHRGGHLYHTTASPLQMFVKSILGQGSIIMLKDFHVEDLHVLIQTARAQLNTAQQQ